MITNPVVLAVKEKDFASKEEALIDMDYDLFDT
jgi:hypothetical protein